MNNMGDVRHEAILLRGGYRVALCDYCSDAKGTDLHHIVQKSQTMHNTQAREASECLELTSWLCQDCHIGTHNVHNPAAMQELLIWNRDTLNLDVQGALDVVNLYLTTPIILEEED